MLILRGAHDLVDFSFSHPGVIFFVTKTYTPRMSGKVPNFEPETRKREERKKGVRSLVRLAWYGVLPAPCYNHVCFGLCTEKQLRKTKPCSGFHTRSIFQIGGCTPWPQREAVRMFISCGDGGTIKTQLVTPQCLWCHVKCAWSLVILHLQTTPRRLEVLFSKAMDGCVCRMLAVLSVPGDYQLPSKYIYVVRETPGCNQHRNSR